MNQSIIRIAQAISIIVLTALFLVGARVEITQAYIGAAVFMSVAITAFGTQGVRWLAARRKGNPG
jgi:uncharacterized Ntn-hydrolase superfamily protein